jgi:thiamine biosynthesis protein ThiS
MTIQLNGREQVVPEGLTLEGLLVWLKVPADRVAVEQNREIVPRARWSVTPVQDHDCLEVVHFVGGGVRDPTDRR